jgi:hypothetical protein
VGSTVDGSFVSGINDVGKEMGSKLGWELLVGFIFDAEGVDDTGA